jgi:transcription-repair coupling factor (superfamily II helicase)
VMIAIPRAAAWTPTAQGSAVIGDTSLLEWAAKSLDDVTKESTL